MMEKRLQGNVAPEVPQIKVSLRKHLGHTVVLLES